MYNWQTNCYNDWRVLNFKLSHYFAIKEPIPFPIKSKIEKKILQIIGNQKLTEINNGITCNIQRLDAISTIPPTGKVSQYHIAQPSVNIRFSPFY
jgi:predicted phosphatase